MTYRIAVGGFQHETNTFAPTKADYAAFEHGGGWPPIQRGEGMAEALRDKNIPVSGFFRQIHALGHRTVPLVWANATPSAQVTRDAYERIAGGIIDTLGQAMPVDAVYLDLHGAMVAEHVDDGEGELLRRVRSVVGPRVPIVSSLDLHANVTRAMIEHADGLVAYRTYPHIDMADTGARAARLLDLVLKRGDRPAKSYRSFEFLIPLTTACTLIEPAKRLYAELARIEAETGTTLSFAPGFPMADFAECGPSVFGCGAGRRETADAVDRLAGLVRDAEADFAPEFLSPDDAVRRAMARGEPGQPVVLADTQDNPGAGGNGDTTGVLAALLRNHAEESVIGLLIDAEAAKAAHQAGPGATLSLSLGGRSGVPGDSPLAGTFTVERLGDGNFPCKGGLYDGAQMRLGPMALLRQGGVRVVLASRKVQAANQDMFRHVGIEPARQRIVAVKSSVHFRADFQPIAREVLVVTAPGPALADPVDFAWKKLRRGVRLKPKGPVYEPPV